MASVFENCEEYILNFSFFFFDIFWCWNVRCDNINELNQDTLLQIIQELLI